MTVERSLPEAAQAKLAALSDAVRDSDALAIAAQSQVEALSEKIEILTRRHETTATHDPRHRSFGDEIAKLEGQQQACREKVQRRRARAGNDRSTVVRATEWLRTVPQGVSLEPVSVPTPNVENFSAAIEATRSELDALQTRRRELRSTALPAADVKAAATAWVTQQAKSVRPLISGAEKGKPFSLKFELAGERTNVPFGIGPLCWLAPEIVANRLHDFIDDTCSASEGLSKKERDERINELDRLILSLERSEEALIEEALARGFDVMRRSRAAPEAILGVDVVTKSRAAKPLPITKAAKQKRSAANGAHVAAA